MLWCRKSISVLLVSAVLLLPSCADLGPADVDVSLPPPEPDSNLLVEYYDESELILLDWKFTVTFDPGWIASSHATIKWRGHGAAGHAFVNEYDMGDSPKRTISNPNAGANPYIGQQELSFSAYLSQIPSCGRKYHLGAFATYYLNMSSIPSSDRYERSVGDYDWKELPSCPVEDGGVGRLGDGPQLEADPDSGGGGNPTCTMYRCGTWYYLDTGEIVSTNCTCISWSN